MCVVRLVAVGAEPLSGSGVSSHREYRSRIGGGQRTGRFFSRHSHGGRAERAVRARRHGLVRIVRPHRLRQSWRTGVRSAAVTPVSAATRPASRNRRHNRFASSAPCVETQGGASCRPDAGHSCDRPTQRKRSIRVDAAKRWLRGAGRRASGDVQYAAGRGAVWWRAGGLVEWVARPPSGLAERPCRAVLPSGLAERPCRAVLPSGLAERPCRAVLPKKRAAQKRTSPPLWAAGRGKEGGRWPGPHIERDGESCYRGALQLGRDSAPAKRPSIPGWEVVAGIGSGWLLFVTQTNERRFDRP